MRERVVLFLPALLLLAPPPTAAQTRDPEVRSYRFVSQVALAPAMWVNPGALAFRHETNLFAQATWDRPQDGDWTISQLLVGIQSGPLALGYRHDEFVIPGPYGQGDAYTVGVGFGSGSSGLGFSRTWHQVGEGEGSWEIGWSMRPPDGRFTAGLVWRDIGSPEVRDTVRDARFVGAVTARPGASGFTVTLEADYRTGPGDFRAFHIGGAYTSQGPLGAFARATWNGDGDFQGLRLGVQFGFQTGLALAVAGLDSGGDAQTGSLGLMVVDRGRGRR